MHIELVRDTEREDATLGTISIGDLVLQTLELPWVPVPGATCGKQDVSCVPSGTYALVRHDSPKHPKTFALVNASLGIFHEPADIPAGTTGRYGCLIHSANFTSQLEGCIALGRSRTLLKGVPMIGFSRVALQAFNTIVPWTDGHMLSIIDENIS